MRQRQHRVRNLWSSTKLKRPRFLLSVRSAAGSALFLEKMSRSLICCPICTVLFEDVAVSIERILHVLSVLRSLFIPPWKMKRTPCVRQTDSNKSNFFCPRAVLQQFLVSYRKSGLQPRILKSPSFLTYPGSSSRNSTWRLWHCWAISEVSHPFRCVRQLMLKWFIFLGAKFRWQPSIFQMLALRDRMRP